VVVMGNEYHVVGIDCTKRSESVAYYGEEGHEDVVDYIDEIGFTCTNIDPTCGGYCWRCSWSEKCKAVKTYQSRKEPMQVRRV
jgi:hypothetical protein